MPLDPTITEDTAEGALIRSLAQGEAPLDALIRLVEDCLSAREDARGTIDANSALLSELRDQLQAQNDLALKAQIEQERQAMRRGRLYEALAYPPEWLRPIIVAGLTLALAWAALQVLPESVALQLLPGGGGG